MPDVIYSTFHFTNRVIDHFCYELCTKATVKFAVF